MQSESREINLLKNLYTKVTPRSLYAIAIQDVLISDDKDQQLELILEFYTEFKFTKYKHCVDWGDKLIQEVIVFVENNPIAIQKLQVKREKY